MTIKKYIITADDVVDNLESTLEDVPLSANQGRELKALIDAGGGGGLLAKIVTSYTGSGTITPSGIIAVLKGDSKTISWSPSTGYEITDVKVDGQSAGRITSKTFTNVQEDHTIDVTFSKIRFTVTKTASGPGSIIGEANPEYGSSQTYSISPNAGARITGVTVDGSARGAVSSVSLTNITANHTITASFVQQYTITASAGSGGSISPAGSQTYDAGSTPVYTISANQGYAIDQVKVDGSVVTVSGGSYTFPALAANHTIAATFKVAPNYTLVIPSGSGNSVSKNITYADGAAGMSETDRDNLIKSHTKFAVVHYSGGKPQVNYWLYRNDLTKRATDESCNTSAGTASNLTGTDGDVMVLYDPVWWKVTKSGANWNITFRWSNPGESGWVSPHTYGDSTSSTSIAKYVGMGVFEGIVSSSQLRSINSSSSPTVSTTQNNFYNAAIASRNWQYNNMLPMTYAWWIICLYFVRGDRNCQAAYGNGLVGKSAASAVNANWSATNAWNNGTTGNQTTGVTALGIQNGWGNVYKFLGECRNDGGTIKFSVLGGKDHSNIESAAGANWKSVSTTTSNGDIVEITGGCQEYPFFATSCSGTDYSTYYADRFYGSSSSARCVLVGGRWNVALQAGPLFAGAGNTASDSSAYMGARLHVLIT